MMAIPFGCLGVAILVLGSLGCGGASQLRDGGSGGDGGGPDGSGGSPDARPGSLRTMVYVGGSDAQIHAFVLDRETLALAPAGNTSAGNDPSFIAFDPAARWLVAVDESAGRVDSFTIDAQSGALSPRDNAGSGGDGPTHVSLDRTGAWVLVADYTSGNAAVLPISGAGDFGTATATVSPGANAHQIVADPSNKNIYVPCLGDDHVARYSFDASAGTLTARTPTASPAGAGPRHIALHPDGKFAYVMNELTSNISMFSIASDGSLASLGAISTLPGGFNGANTGAEIEVHPSGKFVYSSNRGHNSIAVFAVGADGKLTAKGHAPTGGANPRHFSLVLGGKGLLVANQTGGNIVGFHIDAASGALTSVGELTQVPGPAFVGAIDLPAP